MRGAGLPIGACSCFRRAQKAGIGIDSTSTCGAVRMRYGGALSRGRPCWRPRPGEYDVRRIVPVDEHQTQPLPPATPDNNQPSLKARAAALLSWAARSRVALVATTAVVLLAVAGATAGYRSLTTPVTLSVDGQERQLRVSGDTVGDVLDAEGIELTSHDIVQPDPDEAISDGTRIAVRYGRPIDLTVDGKETTHWVTATNVDDAREQIGTL